PTAAKHLKDALALQPDSAEERALLDTVSKGTAPKRPPMERLRANYDEDSFRQLEWEIRSENERKLAKADPTTHSHFHIDRGHMMLSQSFLLEAEKEFREAISLDPALAGAHSGLGMVMATMAMNTPSANLVNGARTEANTSLRLQPNVEAYLVLARLD